MAIKLLIADGFEIVRLGLKKLLEGTDIRIVAQAATGPQALELIAKHKPDVVLLEADLPEIDGMFVVTKIKQLNSKLRMLVYTHHDNPLLAARARALGADGFLDKRSTRNELIRFIQAGAAGEPAWSRTDLRRMATAMAYAPGFDSLEASLSAREIDVIKLMLTGATNEEICRQLRVSYETVKEHVQHLLRKLGLEDRTQAVLWAIRAGAVKPEIPEE